MRLGQAKMFEGENKSQIQGRIERMEYRNKPIPLNSRRGLIPRRKLCGHVSRNAADFERERLLFPFSFFPTSNATQLVHASDKGRDGLFTVAKISIFYVVVEP